jgi:osmotically-inducible protein OsmY
MKTNLLRFVSVTAGVLFLTCGPALAQSSAQQPDNTANNKQDIPTADQPKETPADRDLAKKIRRSIMEDKSLSMYAHNIKVIVRDGEVTLKGPVKSDDERAAIESKASSIAGTGKVENQLTVKQ